MQYKIVATCLLTALTVYSPVELSRLILIYPKYSTWLWNSFFWELVFIWITYAVALVILWYEVRQRVLKHKRLDRH